MKPELLLDLDQRFQSVWERTDRIFAIVAADAMLERPIALRHPFIFYLGHLPAFAWKHVCRGVLGRPSADFFDGKHYVLKGASWATDAQLIRRSFRNWYQARYPYVFAKFRCVRS